MGAARAKITLDSITDIDYERVAGYLTGFLSDYLEASGAKGYVVGVSGGVDSATTLALAVRSVGPGRVVALIMPDTAVTPKVDVDDAIELARSFRVKHYLVKIDPIVEVYRSALPFYESEEADRVPLGNTRARVRMTLLYYYANKYGYLVLGTGDRSEYLLGYFTKYGDGAVDVAPILVLYKSQVRRLALRLGVPERVAFKPSSPRLWPGHLAEKELGVTYDEVDLVLHASFDLGLRPDEIPAATGVGYVKVKAILDRVKESEHKRRPPVSPSLDPVLELMGVKKGP